MKLYNKTRIFVNFFLKYGCVHISACPLHKLESLWYSQTPQNTLTQIFAKTGHTQLFLSEPGPSIQVHY